MRNEHVGAEVVGVVVWSAMEKGNADDLGIRVPPHGCMDMSYYKNSSL